MVSRFRPTPHDRQAGWHPNMGRLTPLPTLRPRPESFPMPTTRSRLRHEAPWLHGYRPPEECPYWDGYVVVDPDGRYWTGIRCGPTTPGAPSSATIAGRSARASRKAAAASASSSKARSPCCPCATGPHRDPQAGRQPSAGPARSAGSTAPPAAPCLPCPTKPASGHAKNAGVSDLRPLLLKAAMDAVRKQNLVE